MSDNVNQSGPRRPHWPATARNQAMPGRPFTRSLVSRAGLWRCAFLLLMCSFANLVHGQWAQQQIALKPGWNAVFLEVHPFPADCDAALAGLPVESVWDFNNASDSPQFVQDPSTLIPGAPGWLAWFPSNHALASQRTLFRLRDGRPYLIKLAQNAPPVTWKVIGKPSLRRLTWRAGALNFVGFHSSAQAPSFQSLFAGEGGLTGQPVYSLDPSGVWRKVADLSATKPKPGEAYWVRCRLPAQRSATIQVDLGSSQGLHFSGGAAEQSVRIRNTSAAARHISVRVLTSASPPAGQPGLAGPVPLVYHRSDYARTNLNWELFSAPLTFTALAAGQDWNLRLGARRSEGSSAAAGSQFQSLLEVTDDQGSRWLIPVTADPTANGRAAAGLQSFGQNSAVRAGLWVGEAVLNAVSQPAHGSDSMAPRKAGGEFSFRLIVHVDGTGTSRVLQHAYLVRKPPTTEPDPEDPEANRVDQHARAVVVTDETLLPGLVGSGELVGRRISSSAFSFKQPLTLEGDPFGNGTLTGTVALGYDDRLNPFQHLYHPDHNNLDERFEQKLPEGKEAFTVSRSVALQFTAADPLGLTPPGWGDSELGGQYRETITGLHRKPLQVSGTFRLVRISDAAFLNQ